MKKMLKRFRQKNNELIAKANADSLTCKICFEKSRNMKQALRHDLKHLKISENAKRNKKRKKQSPNESTNEIQGKLKPQVIKALDSCAPDSEVATLCKIFQPNMTNLNESFKKITRDLTLALGQSYHHEILLFGSTVTGMAFKSSDIDLFIKVHYDMQDFKKVYNDFVRLIRRYIAFTQIIPIAKARVPIIKCCHIGTGYNVDINLSSEAGVYTSRFIANVLYTDSRIHALMIILKIWTKSWEILKFGCMSNYCLALLTFFYLQACEKPLLPPVKEMQKNNASKIIIDNINFGIDSTIEFRTQNKDTLRQLLSNFFEFYSNFQFESFIMSLYLGKPILRADLESEVYDFPEYYQQLDYLRDLERSSQTTRECNTSPLNVTAAIVVQDPFCLNQNKASPISWKLYHKFVKHLAYANNICIEAKQTNQPFGKLLSRLFYEKPDGMNIPRQDILTTEKNNKLVFYCKLNPLENELIWVRMYLRKVYPDSSFDKIDVNKVWAEKIVEYIKEILENMYKIQMNPLPKTENISKTQRTVGQTDVHSNKYSIDCMLKTNLDLWSSRKMEKAKYKLFIQEQLKLTEKYEVERKQLPPVNINCKFSLKPESDFSSVQISVDDFVPKTEKSNLKIFFNEFTTRMRMYFRAYFEKLAKEIN